MFALKGIEHRFEATPALRVESWSAAAGERWLLAGPSGSGKSTLLNLLAGLLRASSGTVLVDGTDLGALREAERDRWRGRRVGIVPQRLHLVSSLCALDNVLLAQFLAGMRVDQAAANALLTSLGIEELASRMPHALSQGQAQRVAVARALINRPVLLLADEPTAALDDDSAQRTVTLLSQQAGSLGATLVVASHDGRIRGAFENRYELGLAT